MQTPLPGMAHTPLPGAAQTPLPGNDSNPFYNIPTGGTPITPNDYASPNENSGVPDVRGGLGRPSQFMVLLLPGLLSFVRLHFVVILSGVFCFWNLIHHVMWYMY